MDKKHTWPHPTKVGSLTCYLFLKTIAMQKIFFLVILMIKESWNLIGQKDKTGQSQPKVLVLDKIMPWWHITWSFLEILMIKESRNLAEQTQAKLVVSGCTFAWWLFPCKKHKTSIDLLQGYWWAKNTTTWLVESILRHN